MVLWSIVAMSQAAIKNKRAFLATRSLLGMLEVSVADSVVADDLDSNLFRAASFLTSYCGFLTSIQAASYQPGSVSSGPP